MKIKIRNHVYDVKALSYNNMFNKNIRICFKKSLLVNNP